MLPCPYCSSVVHEGALTRPLAVIPTWFFAAHTSRSRGRDHWIWKGCVHATAIGPAIGPVAEKEPTETRWNDEAARLLELRCVNWPTAAREKFSKTLGFTS